MSRDPVIGLTMATLLEAAPYIEGLGLAESEGEPFAVYQGDRNRLILSGIGKANAAMACAYLIQRYHPTCILNLGAAGGTDSRTNLGECFHVTKVIEPDRSHLRTGTPYEHAPDVLEGFPGVTLATQDRPVTDAGRRAEVAIHAELVDMEAAAVVQAARRFRLPCYLFKFVSDLPDHTKSAEIEANIKQYRQAFYTFCCDNVLPRLYKGKGS